MQAVGRSILATAILLTMSGIASAATEPPCPNGGYIPDMMVPSKHVAEEIYCAVGRALVPQNFKRYPNVEIEDEGDHWSVSQTDGLPLPKAPPGAVTVSAGGGQLNMDIDKCTGAISHAALAK
jgi:hypothetical protein